MRAIWQSFVDFFTSLKLTVWLLVLSMALVFLATLDQRELGVLGIQQKWFHTFIVIHFIKGFPVPVFLGGYTIGSLLFLNLAAAFVYRFKFAWRKCGIWLTHTGLLLLLAGGFLSGLMQEDYQMRMTEGETKNYSESFHRYEVAVVDTTPADHENVTAIPDNMLARARAGKPLDLRDSGAALPFLVTVRAYYQNAVLTRPDSDPRLASLPTATDGIGLRALAVPVAPTWRQNESNWPAAYIEISDPQSAAPSLPPRTWLLSSQLGAPQTFDHAGRHWRIELRPVRRYTDFSLTLLKVTHDVYPGTDIPKNYASRVLLRAPGDPAGREVLIHMNAPLRHGGLAFYQYQMRAEAGESVLQVVSNPSWRIPYIACALMTIGLLVQFGISLHGYSKRNSPGRARAKPPAEPQKTKTAQPEASPCQDQQGQQEQEEVAKQ